MGSQLPPEKGHTHPTQFFGPCLLWPNGWMDEDATCYACRHRPRPHCVRRGPSCPQRGTTAPLFSSHVYCGHGRPSQLLLSSCITSEKKYSGCQQCVHKYYGLSFSKVRVRVTVRVSVSVSLVYLLWRHLFVRTENSEIQRTEFKS